MTDDKIIDLYLKRNEDAITATGEKYGGRLRNIANIILHDEETACECVNDTYLKTWNSIPPHEPKTFFEAFLQRIVRNVAFDNLRKAKTAKRSGLLVELTKELEECISSKETSVEEAFEDEELGRVISTFLETLPKEQRMVFVRRYWYGASVSLLADQFGFSESKVKSMLHRIRINLKKYLEREGYRV